MASQRAMRRHPFHPPLTKNTQENQQRKKMSYTFRNGRSRSFAFDMIQVPCNEEFDLSAHIAASFAAAEVQEQDVLEEDRVENVTPRPQVTSNTLKRPRSPSPTNNPAPGGLNANPNRRHEKRRRKRNEHQMQHGHQPRSSVVATYVQGATPAITNIQTETLPASSCGFSARDHRAGEKGPAGTLEELKARGYQVIQWDGKTSRPIVDHSGRVFAVLVGQPSNDPTFEKSCQAAFEAMITESLSANFTDADKSDLRGNFPAINVGVTLDPGAKEPTNLNGPHTPMLKRLLENRDIIRLACFADASLALWAPKLYQHYREHMRPLFDTHPHLKPNFRKSIYTEAAFNFGPNVCCLKHRDTTNLSFGWCAIQALGTFDPTQGGHLVLPDLQFLIEFPPGSLIFIPSATLTHANVPTRKGEARASFTQYTGGDLFRYVANGFRTDKKLQNEDSTKFAEMENMKQSRWMKGLELYSTLEDLVKHV